MLVEPRGGDWPAPRKKRGNSLGRHLGQIDITDVTVQGVQDAPFTAKTHAHRLLEIDVVRNRVGERHRSPPTSKRATSRRPGRSTLA